MSKIMSPINNDYLVCAQTEVQKYQQMMQVLRTSSILEYLHQFRSEQATSRAQPHALKNMHGHFAPEMLQMFHIEIMSQIDLDQEQFEDTFANRCSRLTGIGNDGHGSGDHVQHVQNLKSCQHLGTEYKVRSNSRLGIKKNDIPKSNREDPVGTPPLSVKTVSRL